MKAPEVADLLDLSVRKVYELADSGELVSYRHGRALRFDLADVEEYKAKCRSHGTKRASVGNISYAELSAPGVESALIERFRAAGVEPRRKQIGRRFICDRNTAARRWNKAISLVLLHLNHPHICRPKAMSLGG